MKTTYRDSQECLTKAQIDRLNKENFSKTELDILSLHLQNCEICSDVVEGIKTLGYNNLNTHISSIEKKIGRRNNRTILRLLATAACIVLLVVISRAFMQETLIGKLASNEVRNLQNTDQQNPIEERENNPSAIDKSVHLGNQNNGSIETVEFETSITGRHESEITIEEENIIETEEEINDIRQVLADDSYPSTHGDEEAFNYEQELAQEDHLSSNTNPSTPKPNFLGPELSARAVSRDEASLGQSLDRMRIEVDSASLHEHNLDIEDMQQKYPRTTFWVLKANELYILEIQIDSLLPVDKERWIRIVRSLNAQQN